MAEDKFEAVSGALLKILSSKGMRYGDVADAVQAKLPKFEGAVWHYTLRCLRELEVQGRVRRQIGPPTLYFKAPRKTAK